MYYINRRRRKKMFRYSFTRENIEKAKNYLQKQEGVEPSFLKKYKGSVKKGDLYLDEFKIVPREDINEFLRKQVLSAEVPMSRDGLYYHLKVEKYAGIPRGYIDKFLKAQRIIRETDNSQPTTSKKPSRRVNKKGQLAFDLIELNWKDLGFTPTDKGKDEDTGGSETSSRYIFSCADALTGLTFLRYSKTKARTAITPIAKQCFQWFVKNLGLDGMAKLFCLSDKGSEFDFKLYKKWGVRTKQVQRSALIENKNAHVQRVLYRVAKMQKTTKIVELVKRTMAIVNKTQSSITKISPNEAKSVSNKVLAEKYNKNRGKDSGVKLKAKPLKIGDMVRLNKIGVKKDSFYKAYKGVTWTKQSYKVLAKRGDRYKIDGPKGKKFYHREMLRLTSAADQETEMELKRRKKEREQLEVKETKKIRKKIMKSQTVSKRPRRKAAKKAMKKMFDAADRSKEIDKMLE